MFFDEFSRVSVGVLKTGEGYWPELTRVVLD